MTNSTHGVFDDPQGRFRLRVSLGSDGNRPIPPSGRRDPEIVIELKPAARGAGSDEAAESLPGGWGSPELADSVDETGLEADKAGEAGIETEPAMEKSDKMPEEPGPGPMSTFRFELPLSILQSSSRAQAVRLEIALVEPAAGSV